MIISVGRIDTLVFQIPRTSSAPSNLQEQILNQVRMRLFNSYMALTHQIYIFEFDSGFQNLEHSNCLNLLAWSSLLHSDGCLVYLV